MSPSFDTRAGHLVALLSLVVALASPVQASDYEFLASPEIDLNRIFRLDRATGEVGACQYGLPEGSQVGVTICYPPGQGAGAMGPGDYALVNSHHEHESGVWRVDLRSGTISSCFVYRENVVCTVPAK